MGLYAMDHAVPFKLGMLVLVAAGLLYLPIHLSTRWRRSTNKSAEAKGLLKARFTSAGIGFYSILIGIIFAGNIQIAMFPDGALGWWFKAGWGPYAFTALVCLIWGALGTLLERRGLKLFRRNQ